MTHIKDESEKKKCNYQDGCQFRSRVSNNCRLDDPTKCIIYDMKKEIETLKNKVHNLEL